MNLQARFRNGSIEFFDDRSGQVLGTLTPGAGVAVDGATIAVATLVSDDSTLQGDGTEATPLAVKAGGITATELDTATAAAVAIVQAIPTTNQASPAIWNNGGVLKVGTA